MEALEALGGETWFRLGDRDLATHVLRTRRLRAGETLSAITDRFRRAPRHRPAHPADERRPRSHAGPHARRAGSNSRIGSSADAPPRRCGRCEFAGAATARPQPEVLAALQAGPRAVVICPSNPFISIGPILAMPGVRGAIASCGAPVIAVSPIIAGQAVKGPTAKMFAELGTPPTAAAVAAHYGALLDGFVMEEGDDAAASRRGSSAAATLMRSLEDRVALARTVLAAADGAAMSHLGHPAGQGDGGVRSNASRRCSRPRSAAR